MPVTVPLARHSLPALGVELQSYHLPGGAQHLHLATADQHRAFAVAFRTPPTDDCGAPHILEHTALCGSRRFPVRDPFFAMLRRSLQTFMNAMTYPDFTCYPFATQVAKDFDQLLDIYLDATFAPLLDARDFAQEGHRLTPDGQRQGVVYNEMKGALDGTDPQLERAIALALLPDTIYRFESGGDPRSIPRLRHADLLAFHRRCYCAANACFVTYGDLDVASLHARFAPYLAEPGEPLPRPTTQPPLRTPQALTVPVPLAAGQEANDVTAIRLVWACGDGADLDRSLELELLERLLLGHAGAPLRLALENSGLGRSIAGSGVHASYRDLLFSAELDGLEPQDYPRFAPLVEDTLRQVAKTGFTPAELAAALDQLELARREILGDHFPFGLDLCLRVVQAWNLGSDPQAVLDQAPAIARLRQRSTDPQWLRRLVATVLCDNPHRVLVQAQPDSGFAQRTAASEAAAISHDYAALDAASRARLAVEAEALAAHQATPPRLDLLPTLRRADIPAQRRWATLRPHPGVTSCVAASNGVLHQLVVIPLPALTGDDLDLLPLLAAGLGNLGVGARDYAAQAAAINARCGGLWAWHELTADLDDPTLVRAALVIECKGLADRQAAFAELISETLDGLRSDEHQRLGELLDQELQRVQERAQNSGHRLAAHTAARGLGGSASFGHRLSGLGRLRWLQQHSEDAALPALAQRLGGLAKRLAALPRAVALLGDAADRDQVLAAARAAHPRPAALPSPVWPGPSAEPTADLALTTASTVSYHAAVWPGPTLGHPDAPALTVAGHYLTHGFLHPRIREQGGAYGAHANHQAGNAIFACTTFRDPRVAGTCADLAAAPAWLAAIDDSEGPLTEAVLSAIAGLDAPASPVGEGRNRFLAEARGATTQRVDAYRSALLAVTPADLRRVARTWLSSAPRRGLVTSPENAKTLSGWSVEAW